MSMRRVRVRRGSRPLDVYPMRPKEEFDKAWEEKMRGYGPDKQYDTGLNWGRLTRDQFYDKLVEISTKCKVVNEISHYRAWFEHFFGYGYGG